MMPETGYTKGGDGSSENARSTVDSWRRSLTAALHSPHILLPIPELVSSGTLLELANPFRPAVLL
jgi:hypothetical protein